MRARSWPWLLAGLSFLGALPSCGDDGGSPAAFPPPVDCQARITREPYLQDVTETSIRILWNTDEPADAIVEYGRNEKLGKRAWSQDRKLRHLVEITGLEPETEYRYKVRSCGEETTTARFKTASRPSSPFHFTVYGDTQTNFDVHHRVAEQAASLSPDFVLHVGDTVSDGWDPRALDEQFFGPAANLLREAPIYVSIGNHEHESIFYYASFSFPGNNVYYSFTYGNAFFIALDTIRPFVPGTPQYKWFVEQLQSNKSRQAEFRVVFHHFPAYSEGWEGYDGDPLVRLFLVPLMEKYGVDVTFSGHTHDYERGTWHGVTHYITGGGGGALDPWARDLPQVEFWAAVHHFLHVRVDGKAMTIDAIDENGVLFDSYSIVH